MPVRHRGPEGNRRRTEFLDALLKRPKETNLMFWVVTEKNALAGAINVNEIVRGIFRSDYLGYYALVPHDGRGYMKRGLRAVIAEAFRTYRLHRLEANIQPDNTRDRAGEVARISEGRVLSAVFENRRTLARSRTMGYYEGGMAYWLRGGSNVTQLQRLRHSRNRDPITHLKGHGSSLSHWGY